MRYIINDKGYVTDISFGCALVVNGSECTEYTGTVPNEYSNLEEWYAEEELTLWRWKIVNGNLTLDPNATAPEEGDWGKQLFDKYMAGTLEKVDSDFEGKIRDDCFQNFTLLKEAKFSRATGVGHYAFSNCTSLISLELPNVVSLGDYCFQNVSLDYLELPLVQGFGHIVSSSSKIKSLSLPAATNNVNFNNNTVIKALHLPALEHNFSASGCTSLETVYVPKLIDGSGAFPGCTSLTNVYLESLQIIDRNMFRNCSSLKKIDLPDTVIDITGPIDEGCTSLEAFIIRSTTVPNTKNVLFYYSSIASGTGFIYVPKASLEAYKTSNGFSSYASQIRAIEDYPDITAKQVYQHVTQ